MVIVGILLVLVFGAFSVFSGHMVLSPDTEAEQFWVSALTGTSICFGMTLQALLFAWKVRRR